MDDTDLSVQPGAGDEDRTWVAALSAATWGSEKVIVFGDDGPGLLDALVLPSLIAWRSGERVGWLAYREDADSCEIVSLVAVEAFRGIGSALLRSLAVACRASETRKVRLVTSNDNLTALRFYQRRGFRLAALYRDALDHARALKPGLPQLGQDGIPIRDMLELEAAPEDLLAAPPAGDTHD